MQTIQLTIEDTIGKIILNRPRQMNTLNQVMANELLQAVQALEKNDDVRVIITCGAGDAYMAGGDIGFFKENLDNLSTTVDGMIDTVHDLITHIQSSSKLYIALVHGAVAGFGLSLMLAHDFVISSQQTQFTTAYSKIGITPDGGCTYFLPRLVGLQKAKELIMFADMFDVNKAKALGLINFAVANEDLHDYAATFSKRLANGAYLAYSKAKALLNKSFENSLSKQLHLEKEAFIASTLTNDFKTGVNAFIQKQTPEFKGV